MSKPLAPFLFLGGTCGNNNWREGFIEKLVAKGVPADALFDPVVKDWNAEAQQREEEAKKAAAYHLYYLASPKQEGNPLSTYSFVEATMALYDRVHSTVVVFDYEGITGQYLKAMKQAESVLRWRHKDGHFFSPEEALAWVANRIGKK